MLHLQLSVAALCAPLLDLQQVCGLYGPSLPMGQQLCRVLHVEAFLPLQLVWPDHACLLHRRADPQVYYLRVWPSGSLHRGHWLGQFPGRLFAISGLLGLPVHSSGLL